MLFCQEHSDDFSEDTKKCQGIAINIAGLVLPCARRSQTITLGVQAGKTNNSVACSADILRATQPASPTDSSAGGGLCSSLNYGATASLVRALQALQEPQSLALSRREWPSPVGLQGARVLAAVLARA